VIDYLERLEVEVMKAAREQEARINAGRPARPRRRLALNLRALAPVAAVATALVLVIALLPRAHEIEAPPEPLAPVPSQLQGSYSRGDAILIIDPDRYTLDAGGSEIRGDVATRGDQIVLRSDAGGACGGQGEGVYSFTLRDRAVEFVEIGDDCEGRRVALLAGPWPKDG
jgi:hypothetical protein